MSHVTRPCRVVLDNERMVGTISPMLFGGFAEHMGRCVYGGLHDPASSLADQHGFRRDAHAALREMRLSILRYPGGNFLSGYHWRDGLGRATNVLVVIWRGNRSKAINLVPTSLSTIVACLVSSR